MKLLELVLFIGNYLNAGHNKGQSFGFDVDFLPKLRDSKSADNSQTMLHFMANMIENNSEYAMIKGFEEDLRYLPMKYHDLWFCNCHLGQQSVQNVFLKMNLTVK